MSDFTAELRGSETEALWDRPWLSQSKPPPAGHVLPRRAHPPTFPPPSLLSSSLGLATQSSPNSPPPQPPTLVCSWGGESGIGLAAFKGLDSELTPGIFSREMKTCAAQKRTHKCSQQHSSRKPQSGTHPDVHQLTRGRPKCGPSRCGYIRPRRGPTHYSDELQLDTPGKHSLSLWRQEANSRLTRV